MSDEVWYARDLLRRQYETGGWLVGRVERDVVRAVAASGPGPLGELRHRGCGLDPDAGFALERELEEVHGRDDVTIVGAWHCHPDRDGRPSPEDAITAIKQLARVRMLGRDIPFFLVVVVPADERGEHFRPDATAQAWVVRLRERTLEPAAPDRREPDAPRRS
jgi:hypothetical protein